MKDRRRAERAGHDERRILGALDHSPLTRAHKIFLAALFAALVFDFMKPATLSFVIPGVRETWMLTKEQASWLAVSGLAGNVVGAVMWGFLSDRIGRRVALLWTVALFTVSSLCGLSPMYHHALMMCFFMGVGVGGEVPIVFALAAEFIPVKHRGRSLLLLGIAGSIGGYALAAATAAVVKSFYPEVLAWRILWLVGILPAALILVLRAKVVPESARFLLSKGRAADARAAAESLVGPIDDVRVPQEAPKAPPLAIGSGRLLARTTALGFFSFAWGLASFGLIIWLPTLLEGLGWSGATSSAVLALSALIALPAFFVTSFLFTRWSTRNTLVTYAIGGAAMLTLLAVGASKGALTPLFLVAVGGFAFFFINSIGGSFSLYAAEVYPTTVRTGHTGIVAAAGKFGGVVGPYLGGLWFARSEGLLGLLGMLAVSLLAAALVLHLAGVETRERSLEQIAGA